VLRHDRRATAAVPCTARNAAASLALHHRPEGAVRSAGDRGRVEAWPIYHCTRVDPVPSQMDINLAKLGGSDLPAFPGTLYLIVGVKDDEPDLRTRSIVGDEVTQIELQVDG
jgi:hypothetical protein